MADNFSTAAAALSVAALFNNCVDCFEYVRLGRNFAQDYERYQLRIDIAQTRLSRWGKAVAMNNNPRFATISPTDEDTRLVRGILEQIGLMFQSIQKMAQRYELASKPSDLAILQREELGPVAQQLHGHLAEVVRHRQEQTGLFKKAAWALYDEKQYNKLVDQMTSFVDDLETIWPAEAACCELAQFEIEDVDSGPALITLHNTAAGLDSTLGEATAQKVAVKNHAGKLDLQDDARVRIGGEVAQNFSGSFGTKSETNTANTIDARGRSRVHIGSNFGGRSILDD